MSVSHDLGHEESTVDQSNDLVNMRQCVVLFALAECSDLDVCVIHILPLLPFLFLRSFGQDAQIILYSEHARKCN